MISDSVPVELIRPIRSVPASVNQTRPSEPRVMPPGLLPGRRAKNATASVAGSMRPIRSVPAVVNHTRPSGPAVIEFGFDVGGSSIRVVLPSAFTRPTLLAMIRPGFSGS